MSRPLLVLLAAGVTASGCSRDGPVAPEIVAIQEVAAAAPAVVQAARVSDVDDALARVLPALGAPGTPLRGALLQLQARPNSRDALAAVERALDGLASTVSPEFRPDLDALRLELGIPFPQ